MICITLNGESHELAKGLCLGDLLLAMELDPEQVAIERNREIIPRSSFAKTVLQEGDDIEIVHFVGGG